MTAITPNEHQYLTQVTQQARDVMDLYHQGRFQAADIHEHRLSGLINAAMTLKPEWYVPLTGLRRVVIEYSLAPRREMPPEAYLMQQACLALSALSDQQEAA
ncbi:hypothetical protein [Vreelandella utahensis]|uniref:hypothetical protein n=1 Tax=Vreelandella halophila TaxID=86177 RepID=UPI0009876C13|nr:hypothetical protein [Halomonas utahensis]